MSHRIVEIVTTVADRGDAERMARVAIEEGLAACVHADSIRATYRWEGRLREDDEIRLWFKTTPEGADRLVARLEALHPYDTPALIRLEASANDDYANWVRDSVAGDPA